MTSKETEQYFTDTRIETADMLPKRHEARFIHNPRSPDPGATTIADMLETIKHDPEKFYFYNKGIALAGPSWIYPLDGGHTLEAIWQAGEQGFDLSKIKTRITRYPEEMTSHEMNRCGIALNTHIPPSEADTLGAAGRWEDIRQFLREEYSSRIEWKSNENPNATHGVDFVIALMNAWRVKAGTRSYTGKGSLIKEFKNPMAIKKYAKILPHLNTAFDMYCMIAKDIAQSAFCKKSTGANGVRMATELPNGEVLMCEVNQAAVIPILAALSQLLTEDKSEFTADPADFWTEFGGRIIKKAEGIFDRIDRKLAEYAKRPDTYKILSAYVLELKSGRERLKLAVR